MTVVEDPSSERTHITGESHVETPQPNVRLESDDFVREISGQKQCLVLVYDEPARAGHCDEVFDTKPGMVVDDITINVFESSG